MDKTVNEFYTKSFYEEMRNGSRRSAEVIVPLVLQLLTVRSVVDVGCGDGNWLAVFRKLGVEDVLGLDGDYIDQDVLQVPAEYFQVADLTRPFRLKRTFDLAVSLEVAEHLPGERAAAFVESLTRLAPLVLFSAAIPYQGGNHHINEQWPDKWAEHFREHDYVPVDFIRKQIWQSDAVEFWYVQNTLLFARLGMVESSSSLKAEFERTNPNQLSLVHPRQYTHQQGRLAESLARPLIPQPSGIDPIRRAFRARLWHPLLNLTRPIRHKLGLRQKNVQATDKEVNVHKDLADENNDFRNWADREFAAPSPHFVKQKVLLRNGLRDATWVETGTYMGDTTDVLSKVAKMVYSIEPDPTLFSKAEQKFINTSNVKLIKGLSEDVFPKLLPTINGNICFWLDGHYSAGITFKGPQDTPIIDELTAIERNITTMSKIVVMVDDIRCFDPTNPEFSSYPRVDLLVDWARKHNLTWHIEHDIFIAKNH